jgi:hypothetical protein
LNVAKKKITPDETLSTTPVDANIGSAPAPKKRRAPARKTQPPVATATAANGGNGKTQASPIETKPAPTEAEIAEAAYYRHLNRGGAHGDQFNDWVEAERELRARRERSSR